MSKHLTRELAARNATVRTDLLQPLVVDRTFELPRVLYAATVGLYLAALCVLVAGFASPGLILPLAIFAIVIAGGFGIPALWTRMQPNNPAAPMAWDRFRRQGIATLTGHLTAGEAAAQMLVLPVLISAWALACITIAALM